MERASRRAARGVTAHGHAPTRGRSPFAPAAPSIVTAAVFAAATLVWATVGDPLPGGRWLAVHLFTLGVLTNLVLTFSEHFARTLSRAAGERAGWWPLVTNAAIVTLLVGVVADRHLVLGTGATVLTAVVFAAYLRLRRMRRASVGARFTWVVRVYERAHGAFIHGAIFGALLGVGAVSGAWYGGFRLAHLHAQVLGWGGLTLLATLVFFGPTMARVRIEPGADARASRALRWGATGLSVGVLALLLTGAGDPFGTIARLVAAVGLAAFAASATVVCLPVVRAVVTGPHSASRSLVAAVAVWLPVVTWADAVVVASGAWRWLDALGIAALTGALAQAMLATLLYLAPMLFGRTAATRERLRDRLAFASGWRTGLFNLGVVALAVHAASAADLPVLAVVGWGLLTALLASSLLLAIWPTPPVDETAS